ncbi:MAG: hypothetical protein PWP20_437 [Eubacteriaceae bacterium]|nr:hypothetical protein [Eubacteriaceae bacterium]
MNVIVNNRTFEFDNNEKTVKDLFNAIQELLDQEGLEFSHLIVDSTPVYQEFENYLTNDFELFKEIVVETVNLKTLISDTIASAFEYIARNTALVKALAESFYQSPQQETWQSLSDLFEGIGWLLDVTSRIDQFDQLSNYVLDYSIWNEYVQTAKGLDNLLSEMEEAMVNKDHVLIGDLILYEILPVFETAEEKLRFLMPGGENHAS